MHYYICHQTEVLRAHVPIETVTKSLTENIKRVSQDSWMYTYIKNKQEENYNISDTLSLLIRVNMCLSSGMVYSTCLPRGHSKSLMWTRVDFIHLFDDLLLEFIKALRLNLDLEVKD